jgi:chorismate mutase
MSHNPKFHPLDPLHQGIDEEHHQVIKMLTRRGDAVKRVGTVKGDEDTPPLDTECERWIQASWIQEAEALDQSPIAHRVLKEILNLSRRIQEDLRSLCDADRQFELPSIAEVLTIQQCGFLRTYNLNDGMGPDIACQCPVSEMSLSHLQLDLARLGS